MEFMTDSAGKATASPSHELITGLDDRGEAYPIDKMDAHRVSTRHLAVSVFLFQGERLLLQRRADQKYHSGGLWANSCCSHPRWRETPSQCAERRVPEELGVSVPLEHFAVSEYSARVGSLFENEVVHCYRGELPRGTDVSRFNPEEVQDVTWLNLRELKAELSANPERYAAWLHIYMRRHRDPGQGFAIPGWAASEMAR